MFLDRFFGPTGRAAAVTPAPDLPAWLQNKILRKFAARYADILESCRRSVDGAAPLLIGPWTSEVGYELLYWLPMVRFLQRRFKWDRGRAHVVSRGGAAVWYGDVAAGSCDLFDVMTLDEYTAGNERRWKAMHGSQKQKRMTAVDEDALALAARRLDIGTPATLHPKVMYNSLQLYWNGILGLEWYDSLTHIAPLPVPDLGMRQRLPDDYFAVKFYFRPSFPDTAENRRFIDAFITHLSALKPVVVLETGQRFDEHVEYAATAGGDRVVRLDLSASPTMNLALQTEVIARAAGYYGTYGGLSYLPMYFGVPSTGFVSNDDRVHLLHQTAAEHACSILRQQHGLANARLRVLNTADVPALAGVP